MAETVAEAHVLAEKVGLPNEVLHRLIGENYGAYAQSISDKLINGIYIPEKGGRARSDLNLAIKDVGHGIAAAKAAGTRLKIAELTMEHLKEAQRWSEKEDRQLDSSAVYGIVRQHAGLGFETNQA